MFAQFFRKNLIFRALGIILIINFILTSIPAGAYAGLGRATLRTKATDDDPVLAKKIITDTVLGDYKVARTDDSLPFGYVKEIIDLRRTSAAAKEKLAEVFKVQIQDGEEYSLLHFTEVPIAIVKKSASGQVEIVKLLEDLNNISLDAIAENADELRNNGVKAIDLVLQDYLFFEERAKTPVAKRWTLTFKEGGEHKIEFEKQKKEYEKRLEALDKNAASDNTAAQELEALRAEFKEFMMQDGVALLGGKGLSLSETGVVADVPPGFNVTTTAYFDMVRQNKEVYDLIDTELRNLDTMDDQKRDVVARDIREAMMRGQIPAAIAEEVLVMYRHLNIIRHLVGKDTPTAVAVRSSGIKEDIKVESWLPITTGSQAGQSDTFLNVRGQKNLLEKLKADWASLFTDRAVSYRDDAIFLIFSGLMGFKDKQPKAVYYDLLGKLREYAEKLDKPEFNRLADTLTSYANPGSVNLMDAMEEILRQEDNPEIAHALSVMRETAEEFVHPEQIGIDVVMLQMVRSALSGVIFTVDPATGMAGVPQALYNSWYMKDDSLVYRDESGRITGTKPIAINFDISYGYGENVVGGKVDPDKFEYATYDGNHWFNIGKRKGSKLIQMVDVERSIELLERKIPEATIRAIASLVKQAISYEEVGKQINGILATRLYGIKYLKEQEGKKEDDKAKKERLQRVAENMAQMIRDGKDQADIEQFIRKEFYVVSDKSGRGILDTTLGDVIQKAYNLAADAKKVSLDGKAGLAKEYFRSAENTDAFLLMLKEVWENNDFGVIQDTRKNILKTLGGLEEKELRNLSYLMRSLVDDSFTANIETTSAHQDTFAITDEEGVYIVKMAWAIADYFHDQRDLEFGIEFDPSAPEGKRIEIYGFDEEGNVLGANKKGEVVILKGKTRQEALAKKEAKAFMRLYNLQARPYTAEHIKVDYVRRGTEADEKFIEDKGIKPIAEGTKGQNATHAYVLVFDPSQTIDWHAREIQRLKDGKFTVEERAQIKKLGFNPDDYGEGKEEKLPVALYLLEADPSHDPIMRLADAVITIRGGDTCHAAIFCREQGKSAVTGVGKVLLNGKLLTTGIGLTVDANNGRLYKLEADPAKRIPILFVKFKIKPYGIPGAIKKGPHEVMDEDGFKVPTIGMISAAAGSAKQNTPIMLAPDSAGVALTRAEFKGEEIGLNVFAGYGYDLIQAIRSGEIQRPERITVNSLIDAVNKDKATQAFIDRVNEELYQCVKDKPEFLAEFERVFSGPGYAKESGVSLLQAFDIMSDIKAGKLGESDLDYGQQNLLSFINNIPGEEGANALEYYYGVMQRKYNYDYNIITALENHPWILEEVEAKLKEKGYSSFQEYAGKEFFYFYNLMGFTIAPDQKAKNRAYDFAQDKVRGMPGSEVFSWPGVNPLVGLRGTALEIEGIDEESEGNQRVLSFLLEAVIDADENTHNQAWFYVFVRSDREMDMLDKVLGKIAKKKGKLPKQIGIMIEVPSDAMLAEALGKKLKAIKEKYAKYGVEDIFFSFGTNDYSFLAGKGDREDPRMKLKFRDPAAIKAIAEIKAAGYYYDDASGVLPLVDEGSDVVIQLIEAVVREANGLDIDTSLCGEAITSLVNRGDYESAGKIMGLLESFGISMMKVRLLASMVRFDVISATKELAVPEAEKDVLFDLSANGQVKQKTGVVKGEVIYVGNADDLVPDALKGLEGAAREAKKESLKMQSLADAQSTMRTYDKIVVLSKNLIAQTREELDLNDSAIKILSEHGLIKAVEDDMFIWTNLGINEDKFAAQLKTINGLSADAQKSVLQAWKKAWNNTTEGLERRGIDWDDLQYAKAIIIDSGVNMEGWDVVTSGIVPTRIKAVVKGIGKLRGTLEGQMVTIDYASGKVYKGNLAVNKKEVQPRALPIPTHEPRVETIQAVREDANDVYINMQYHPLLLLAYEKGLLDKDDLGGMGETFNEYVGRFIEEMNGIARERNDAKREWLLDGFRAGLANLKEPVLRTFLENALQKVVDRGEEITENEQKMMIGNVRPRYFRALKEEIGALLNGKSASEFIKDTFKANMQEVVEANAGKLVLHTTTSLNSAYFYNMPGGFLVDQVNPNPDHGLLGADRAVDDFYEVNRLELQAFKEVRAALAASDRKNFGLQITEFKGTQSGAVVIAWRYVLEDMDIIPGQDGLEVGLNIATVTDTLALDRYFEHFDSLGDGLTFVTYSRMPLGAAWAGTDIYWNEWRRLQRESELKERGDTAIKIFKGKIEAANIANPGVVKKVVEFEEKARGKKAIDTRA